MTTTVRTARDEYGPAGPGITYDGYHCEGSYRPHDVLHVLHRDGNYHDGRGLIEARCQICHKWLLVRADGKNRRHTP